MAYSNFGEAATNASTFRDFELAMERRDRDPESPIPIFTPLFLFGQPLQGWNRFYKDVAANPGNWRSLLNNARTQTQQSLEVFLEKRLREKAGLTSRRRSGYMRQSARVEVTHEMVLRMGYIAWTKKVYRKRFSNASDEDIARAIKPALDALKHGFIVRIQDLLGRP